MSVRDHIKPIPDHHLGVPPFMLRELYTMGLNAPKQHIEVTKVLYDKLCALAEAALSGNIPSDVVDSEEKAAMYATHLILDAAVLHDALSHCGVPVGEFPFNDLADKIFPKGVDKPEVLQ